MAKPIFIKAQDELIPIELVKLASGKHLEEGVLDIQTWDGVWYHAYGFDAVEAMMILKPSYLEG
jgi:hypothetical protein